MKNCVTSNLNNHVLPPSYTLCNKTESVGWSQCRAKSYMQHLPPKVTDESGSRESGFMEWLAQPLRTVYLVKLYGASPAEVQHPLVYSFSKDGRTSQRTIVHLDLERSDLFVPSPLYKNLRGLTCLCYLPHIRIHKWHPCSTVLPSLEGLRVVTPLHLCASTHN